MIPITGIHRVPLPSPVDRGSFLDIVELVESQKAHEKKIQAKIDKLSKAVIALEVEKYRLHSETNNYLYEVTSHHQRTAHVVFEYPDARLEEESCLESATNRAIKINSIIEVNEDKKQPIPTQPKQ